jgi:hypothetical protein
MVRYAYYPKLQNFLTDFSIKVQNFSYLFFLNSRLQICIYIVKVLCCLQVHKIENFFGSDFEFWFFHCWFSLNANYNKQQLENGSALQLSSPTWSKPPLQASITKKAYPLAPLLLQDAIQVSSFVCSLCGAYISSIAETHLLTE